MIYLQLFPEFLRHSYLLFTNLTTSSSARYFILTGRMKKTSPDNRDTSAQRPGTTTNSNSYWQHSRWSFWRSTYRSYRTNGIYESEKHPTDFPKHFRSSSKNTGKTKSTEYESLGEWRQRWSAVRPVCEAQRSVPFWSPSISLRTRRFQDRLKAGSASTRYYYMR